MGVHVLSIPISDDGGKIRAMNLYMDDSETITNIQSFITAFVPKLDAVTGGKITNVLLQFSLDKGTPKAAAVDDCPVNQGALFGFSVVDTQYRHSAFVPAIRKTLVAGEVIANTGAVQTLQESILSGEGYITLTNKAAQDLDSFLEVEPSDRKRAK